MFAETMPVGTNATGVTWVPRPICTRHSLSDTTWKEPRTVSNLEESLKMQAHVVRRIKKVMGLLDDHARAAIVQWFHESYGAPAKGPGLAKA
jgi:hypothetical protein